MTNNPVVQQDRERAVAIILLWQEHGYDTLWRGQILSGERDDHSLVQAFAAHRQATLEEAAKGEYCRHCSCDLCAKHRQDRNVRSALDSDALTRCWSCSCGWVECYTQSDLAEHGEPSECQKCYRERLEEIDRATAIRNLGRTDR